MSFRCQHFDKPELLRRYLKVGYYQNKAEGFFGKYMKKPNLSVDEN